MARRLDTMDFINRGMVFDVTLLLCLFPFLIVVGALAGRPAAQSLTRYTGVLPSVRVLGASGNAHAE